MVFNFVDEPMRYEEVAEVFSGMHELVVQTVDMFIEGASKSIEECGRSVTAGEANTNMIGLFRSASHSMKGSSGLIKAMKLHIACVTLSDLAKYQADNIGKREACLDLVQSEFNRLVQYKRAVLDQMRPGDSTAGFMAAMPNTSPLNLYELVKRVGTREVAIDAVSDFSNDLYRGLEDVAAYINNDQMQAAIDRCNGLWDASAAVCTEFTQVALLGLHDIMGDEADAKEKHLMYVEVIIEEGRKIQAYVDHLKSSDCVDLVTLLAQLGGSGQLAKQVVKEFLSSNMGRMSKLYSSLEADDVGTIKNEVTELQFEASQMFISAFDETCEKMKAACDFSNFDVIEEGIGSIRNILNELGQAIRELKA